jgi:hypothetical protein
MGERHMSDIDDGGGGIGPEEMGLIGAMAEGIADEERELRRLQRQTEGESEDEEDSLQADDDIPVRSARRRLPRKGPTGSRGELFLRWVNDFNRGRKGRHDSMYGPPRSPEDGRPFATDIDFFGVRVLNAHLVSDRFMHLVYVCMVRFRDHDLRAIVFTDDGTPVVNGVEEFGIFDAQARTITLNLRMHFERAVRVVEHDNTGSSLIALIWKGMARTFLHELAHALDTRRRPEAGRSREDREAFADGWAAETLTLLACQGQLEPPKAEEEHYFGPLVARHLEEGLAAGWGWAKRQKSLLDSGMIYRDDEAGIALKTEKEFHELSLAGRKGDSAGERLNEGIKRGQAREEAAWDREEGLERLLREAMYGRRRVSLAFRVSDVEARRLAGTPMALSKKGPFLEARLLPTENEEPVDVRIDRITDLTAGNGGGEGGSAA